MNPPSAAGSGAGPQPDAPAVPVALPTAPVLTESVVEHPHPLTPVIEGWIAAFGFLVIIGREVLMSRLEGADTSGASFTALGIAFGALFVWQLVTGFIAWRTTQYVIDDHQIRIERNFINHTQTQILFERVQSVDVYAPFMARICGLAGLRIDAGATEAAHTISLLPKQKALALRDYLLARAHGAQVSIADTVALTPPGDEGHSDGPVPSRMIQRARANLVSDQVAASDRVIVTTDTKRLLIAAFTSDQVIAAILTALIFVAFVVAMLIFGVDPGDADIRQMMVVLIVIGGVLPLFMAVWSTVSKFWNFKLTRTEHGLRVSRGLTSTISRVIPLQRIQGIRIKQPWLWRPFGMYQLQCTVLGDSVIESDAATDTNPTLAAVVDRATIDAVCAQIWPGFHLDDFAWHVLPSCAKWVQPLSWRFNAWDTTDFAIGTRSGLFSRSIEIVPHARVQSIRIKQGPLQRHFGLATLWVDISDGAVTWFCENVALGDAQWVARTELDRTRLGRQDEQERGWLAALPEPAAASLIEPA